MTACRALTRSGATGFLAETVEGLALAATGGPECQMPQQPPGPSCLGEGGKLPSVASQASEVTPCLPAGFCGHWGRQGVEPAEAPGLGEREEAWSGRRYSRMIEASSSGWGGHLPWAWPCRQQGTGTPQGTGTLACGETFDVVRVLQKGRDQSPALLPNHTVAKGLGRCVRVYMCVCMRVCARPRTGAYFLTYKNSDRLPGLFRQDLA